MSDIKEQWQQSVAEFGDRAHERFLINFKTDWLNAADNKTIAMTPCHLLKLKPIAELFVHDVEVYGDDAYLMWTIKSNGVVTNAVNNQSVFIDAYVRKNSAGLPFDLERAKAGDAGEVLHDGCWIDFKRWLLSGDDGIDNISFQYPADLRMKFPPKI